MMRHIKGYDFSARWYDQQLCRFTTPDPLQEKYPHLSPYLYCAANPLRYTKSTGWINGHELKNTLWRYHETSMV